MKTRILQFTSRLLFILSIPLFHSCLEKNDMAYPKILGEVLEFEVEGQESVKIDKEKKIIEVVLKETADMASVNLTKFKISEKAFCSTIEEGMNLNLSDTVSFTLTTYQKYEWKIATSQPIERYVKCEGLVGEPIFDLKSKLVTVFVSDKLSLLNITINDMKLEAEGSVIKYYEEKDENGQIQNIPITSFPLTLNCNFWRFFIVESKGETFRWGVNLLKQPVSLEISSTNAWAKKVDIEGQLEGDEGTILKLRVKGTEEWKDCPDINVNGNTFSATVTGLEPQTEYEVKVVCGEKSSETVTFTTEAAQTLPNLSFDNWHKNGKIWYPNAEGVDMIWDSANPGSGNFGFIPTTPTDETAVSGDGKKAAKLESMHAVIAFAAGNIYTGKFGAIAGVGATLDWGIPFESRPSSLTGYYKYSPQTINKANPPYDNLKGQGDICQITVFITDWEKPFTINTQKGEFVDFENDPHIIAAGRLERSETMAEYEKFTIDLEYRDLQRKPKYIIITATSSKYGDYFTGGVGSTLLIDEFELNYE